MANTIKLDGEKLALTIRERVAAELEELFRGSGVTPGLATLQVGDNPAGASHLAHVRGAAHAAGMRDLHCRLPRGAGHDRIAAAIDELGADPKVSGIVVDLRLPVGLDASALIDRIPAEKDVNGLTTLSAGRLARGQSGFRPSAPLGVMTLLEGAGVRISGSRGRRGKHWAWCPDGGGMSAALRGH